MYHGARGEGKQLVTARGTYDITSPTGWPGITISHPVSTAPFAPRLDSRLSIFAVIPLLCCVLLQIVVVACKDYYNARPAWRQLEASVLLVCLSAAYGERMFEPQTFNKPRSSNVPLLSPLPPACYHHCCALHRGSKCQHCQSSLALLYLIGCCAQSLLATRSPCDGRGQCPWCPRPPRPVPARELGGDYGV